LSSTFHPSRLGADGTRPVRIRHLPGSARWQDYLAERAMADDV
jgi:hypothetical protein